MPAKSGAPVGNLNATRNGARLHRLAFGELPPQFSRITRYCRAYRRALETEVLAVHGEVSFTHAHYIDSACGHEQHGAICRWLLRERLDTMATADIRECARAVAGARDSRNKAMRELGLDRDSQANVLQALYSEGKSNDDK